MGDRLGVDARLPETSQPSMRTTRAPDRLALTVPHGAICSAGSRTSTRGYCQRRPKREGAGPYLFARNALMYSEPAGKARWTSVGRFQSSTSIDQPRATEPEHLHRHSVALDRELRGRDRGQAHSRCPRAADAPRTTMSHAWAINGPLPTAIAGRPRSAMSAGGRLSYRLQAQRPRPSKLVMRVRFSSPAP
jgi:hypothetical protein